MKHIVNVVLDEKFIDDVIVYHDSVDSCSEHLYYYITDISDYCFKYIKNVNRIIRISVDDFMSIINNSNVDAIFLHCLYSLPLEYLPQIKREIKVFWFAWGYDMYGNSLLIPINLYHPLTKAFLFKEDSIRRRILYSLKKIYRWLFRTDWNRLLYENAVSRIDYFSGVLPIEYDLAKKKKYFNAKRVEYKYFSLQSMKISCSVDSTEKKNILIGNSSAPTNNHLDIFNLLKDVDLDDKRVYVPLSYGGGDDRYIEKVVAEGEKLWGENFVPLLGFIPMNDYMSIIESCDSIVFLHERQQALGNIHAALRRGCKVFLSNSSVTYKEYSSLGFRIFSTQDDLNTEIISSSLSMEEINNNFVLMNKIHNIDINKKRLQDIYDVI